MNQEDKVTQASAILWDHGVRILQGNRLADTDMDHVKTLARYMKLNGEQRIADMGCGFGEVSRLLAQLLPKETSFWLVNNNLFQLTKCPFDRRFPVTHEDLCATSIPPRSTDLVMFNYSLCLVEPRRALKEANRIADRKGALFIYDYERTGGDNALTQEHLLADFLTDQEFRALCADTGWRNVETIHPGGNDAMFREAVGNDELYDSMFKDLQPVIWKATQ